ncbi:hypothetical protein WG915_08905 [Corynebacterium sp. H128]|uniref:hypothetical protein n=1 Tax=Corynebacterium sp. H128 TaxID=3133427 RepID=UPI0030B334C0
MYSHKYSEGQAHTRSINIKPHNDTQGLRIRMKYGKRATFIILPHEEAIDLHATLTDHLEAL